VLRQVALRTESKDTNNESGYPALISYVRADVVDHAADLAKRSVLNDALRAVEYMEQPFIAEAQSLASPEKAQAMADRLATAKADADRLRSQAARWQTTMSDGFGDLNSDVDQDLRTRMRETSRVAEDAIDNSDPGKSWEEFRTWLTQRVTYEVVQNFSVIAQRARELADLVAVHFEAEADAIAPEFAIEIPSATLEALSAQSLETKEMRAVAVGFQAMRGAYSNISMFTMAGNMVHMAVGLTNPVTIVIGLLSGGKAIKDVKDRELTARRQQAKAAVRRYIDDVNFNVGKDFRDTIRHLQRELRETFSSRAEELQRSTAEALTAVQQTAQKDQAERQQRLQALDTDLKRLATVKQRLAAMAPELSSPQPA
jgi:FtsZ-binding cell division protein ZapB